MASFNLGRIKGDAGPAGVQGPKGDKGEKGDKGDKGEQGNSGYTPIFTINETQTVLPDESARVEINTDIPQSPVLTFYIPKGKDGKDALGDMVSSIYDSKGIRKDIFEYVDALAGLCIKKGGDTFTGKVKAYSDNIADSCIRNIIVAKNLPDNALSGDIGIVLESTNSLTLNDQNIGTIVTVKEDGIDAPYIIAGKNYHKEGTVTLIRRDLLPYSGCFDFQYRKTYDMSNADMYLENIYLKELDDTFKKNIVTISLINCGKRRVFLPTYDDLNYLEYFRTNSKVAQTIGSSRNSSYWTRTLTTDKVGTINSLGEEELLTPSEKAGFRPLIVLSGDAAVENTVFEEAHSVKLQEKKRGLYVFDGGIWKECL